MSEESSVQEQKPVDESAGSGNSWSRATRRGVLGGAGATIAAVLAACGATKKSSSSSASAAGGVIQPTGEPEPVGTVSLTPSTVTNSQMAGGSIATEKVSFNLNGKDMKVEAVEGTMLLYVLRDQLDQHGCKFGCGLSECGACAVLQDGKQIRSCVTPFSSVENKSIVTLDGLADSYHGPGKTLDGLHPLQSAWIEEQVPQCGYCQSGMIIQAADLLTTTPNPTVEQIKANMEGHLCRCGTYNGIVRAIQRASEVMS